MNLAEMLLRRPQTLDEVYRNLSKTKTKPKPEKPKRELDSGNISRRVVSQARYRAVMGGEWVATREIEIRLGTTRSTAYKVLEKWLEVGDVERREVRREQPPGWFWEWRWVK